LKDGRVGQHIAPIGKMLTLPAEGEGFDPLPRAGLTKAGAPFGKKMWGLNTGSK